MNRQKQNWTLAGGLGLGAGLMYLLDPQRGGRRRALLRDKAVHATKVGRDGLGKTSRDLAHRSKGLLAETRSTLRREEPTDELLADRVRSRLGRLVTHPSAVEVTARDGRVTLSGPVLATELDRLLSGVEKVRGVREVENRLEAHERPGDVPGLQGPGSVPHRPRENWAPGTRLLTSAAGGALAVTGLRRGGALGSALGALGLGLFARGATNLPAQRLLGVGAGRRAVEIQKTIHVDAPIGEVFDFWASFENFPRFMENVLEVRDTGNGRSHWVVRGPAGTRLEWNAEITRFEPNQVIAWKTDRESAVDNAGIVRFEPSETGSGTRVSVRFSYNPPGGAVGHGVAALLGRDPKRTMDEDLVRFKSLLEQGKATAKGQEVHREEVQPLHG